MNEFKSFTFRDYCACCANFTRVSRFTSGEYFCGKCKRKIASRLRKRGIDLTVRSPDLNELRTAVDEVVENIQNTLSGEKRVQRRDYKNAQKKWWKYRNGERDGSGEPPR